MLRWLSRQRLSSITLLLAVGLLGAFLDRVPDEPSRLHTRSRASRSVKLGEDLHAADHALVSHGQPSFGDTLLGAFLPSTAVLPPVLFAAELLAPPVLTSCSAPLSQHRGRAPPCC